MAIIISYKTVNTINYTVVRRLNGPERLGSIAGFAEYSYNGRMANNRSTAVLTPFIIYCRLVDYYTQLIT